MSRESHDNASDGYEVRAAAIARHYQFVFRESDDGWVGRAVEMPGVVMQHEAMDACAQRLRAGVQRAIVHMLQRGEVPPVSGKRTVQVNVRFTAEEKLGMEASAYREGFSGVSEFIRHKVLKSMSKSA